MEPTEHERQSLESIRFAPDFGRLPEDAAKPERAFRQANKMRDDLLAYFDAEHERAERLEMALIAARDWHGLDGDGISDPTIQLILDALAGAPKEEPK